jgi:hypothetical protein
MNQYLKETKMLDFSNPDIQKSIKNKRCAKIKSLAYRHLGRHLMNHNVKK